MVSGVLTGSFILSNFLKWMVETSGFSLIVVNLFFIHGKPIIMGNWGISVKKKRVNCGLWPEGAKSIYTKWVTGPEPVALPSKPCNGINFIRGMEENPCCCAYLLSIKVSPVAPVSNKVLGSSDNSLNLTVHRMTKCLFKTSTEFAGVKVKTEINKRDGSCKRLDAKFKLFPVAVLQGKLQWQAGLSLLLMT